MLKGSFIGIAKKNAQGIYSVKTVLKDTTLGNVKLIGTINTTANTFTGTYEKIKQTCPEGCVSATPIDPITQIVPVTGVITNRNILWTLLSSQTIRGNFTENANSVIVSATGNPVVHTNFSSVLGSGGNFRINFSNILGSSGNFRIG